MRQQAIVGNTNFCAFNFEPFAIRRRLTSDLRFLTSGLCALLIAISFPAEAQQVKKSARIGVLVGSSAAGVRTRLEAFRDGLRELGYIEGKNIVIDYRYADGKSERLPALAAELIALKADVLVSTGPASTRAAKQASR